MSEAIKVGISLGDYNGIGMEVILKTLNNPDLNKLCTPVLYASPKVFSYYKKLLDMQQLNLKFTNDANQLHDKKSNLVVCWEEETPINPGQASSGSGEYAFRSLERATQDILEGKIDVLVTAPLDKSTVNKADRPFTGHTEYLAQQANSDHLMVLTCDELRVALVTGHVPLNAVAEKITKDKVLGRIQAFEASLKKDFGIVKPRIAVLGLNPHAGDKGLLGKEDSEQIQPAVKKASESGILAFGPYPADGIFGSGEYKKFDGVLAMYHDQGLIPFKLMGFEDGVNFTAGLPFVRTSPDHGTAYNIAGKNLAVEGSFRNALYLAIDVFRKRKNLEEYPHTLSFKELRRERFRMDF